MYLEYKKKRDLQIEISFFFMQFSKGQNHNCIQDLVYQKTTRM